MHVVPHSKSNLGALVCNCAEGDLLVITECESLNKGVLEGLIQVIEQFEIAVEIPSRIPARTVRILGIPLKHFTLVFTTSKPSQIDRRLRRWLIPYDFAPYTRNELVQIITRLAAENGASIENSAAELLVGFAGGLLATRKF